MKLQPIRLAVVGGVLALFSLPAAGQSVLLKPKFKTGEKFYAEITSSASQEIKGPMAGPDGMTINVQQIEGMLCEVKSASPESTELEMTFDRVGQFLDMAMMPARFDSDMDDPKDPSNQAAVALGPKLGMSLKMKLGPDGRVVECTGMEDVVAKLEKEALGVALFEQERPALTDERMASQWSTAFGALYPNREVKSGDTWTNTLPYLVPRMGNVTYVFNCKADSIVEEGGRKYLVIRYDGTIQVPEEMKSKPNQYGMVVQKFDGTHSGVAKYDIERGLITSQHSKQTFDMTMGMPQPEPTTQPAEGPPPMQVSVVAHLNGDMIICSVADREKMKAEHAAQAAAQQDDTSDADSDDDDD